MGIAGTKVPSYKPFLEISILTGCSSMLPGQVNIGYSSNEPSISRQRAGPKSNETYEQQVLMENRESTESPTGIDEY